MDIVSNMLRLFYSDVLKFKVGKSKVECRFTC